MEEKDPEVNLRM